MKTSANDELLLLLFRYPSPCIFLTLRVTSDEINHFLFSDSVALLVSACYRITRTASPDARPCTHSNSHSVTVSYARTRLMNENKLIFISFDFPFFSLAAFARTMPDCTNVLCTCLLQWWFWCYRCTNARKHVQHSYRVIAQLSFMHTNLRFSFHHFIFLFEWCLMITESFYRFAQKKKKKIERNRNSDSRQCRIKRRIYASRTRFLVNRNGRK